MNVFGHDHVSGNDELIAAANLLQHGQKQIAMRWSAEQWTAVITTAGDEMKVSGTVMTSRLVPHGNSIAG
jgi:hypothetical protein